MEPSFQSRILPQTQSALGWPVGTKAFPKSKLASANPRIQRAFQETSCGIQTGLDTLVPDSKVSAGDRPVSRPSTVSTLRRVLDKPCQISFLCDSVGFAES